MGLVLFGGGSLAIYMNGIAQEFFHAVQGNGIFKLMKAITDSEIVVDIISGTSAGGINGIFLAYALTNRADFSQCSRLWLEQGNIGQLLRSPFQGPATSLLNSEGYYLPKLQAAFQAMGGRTNSPLDPFESPVNELDLFVTGTDFYGETHTEFDDAGHAIDVMQHRALFKLKHRAHRSPDRATDFYNGSVTHQALGKLAQITSAFPAAFAPVTVTGPNDPLALGNTGLRQVDEKLRRWGRLTRRKHFVDGGVLANKPFTPTVEAIFNRAAEREVDRYLCYVDPDPECFKNTDAPFPPQALQNAVAALSTLPRYQSISADLDAIAEHNSQIEEFARFCRKQQLPSAPIDPWNVTDALYRQARLMAISNRAIEGVLKVSGASVRLVGGARDTASDLVQSFDAMMLDASGHDENAARSLRDFDIYFRRRRLFDQIYRIYDKLYAPDHDPSMADRYRPLWRKLNGRNQFLEVVQHHMERTIDEASFGWQPKFAGAGNDRQQAAAKCLWVQMQALLRHLLNLHGDDSGNGLDPHACEPQTLDRLSDALRARSARLVKDMPPQDPPDFQNLLCAADQMEGEVMEEMRAVDPGLAAVYNGFAAVDGALFPAQFLSRLDSRDTLKIVRFDPLDSAVGLTDGLQPKVLGNQLGDFGGFLKKSWRANDICFGRLDGAAQLIQLLLSGKAAARNRNQHASVRDAVLAGNGDFQEGMSPQELFPHSDPQQMRELIMNLTDGNWNESVRSKLVEAAQIEIFYEELKHMDIHPSEVKQFASEKQFLQSGYKTRQESWKSLVRPASTPVLIKGLAALSMLVLGLKLIQPSHRIARPASK